MVLARAGVQAANTLWRARGGCWFSTYPDLYHEIFNEATHERVLQDVCDWIISRMSATT